MTALCEATAAPVGVAATALVTGDKSEKSLEHVPQPGSLRSTFGRAAHLSPWPRSTLLPDCGPALGSVSLPWKSIFWPLPPLKMIFRLASQSLLQLSFQLGKLLQTSSFPTFHGLLRRHGLQASFLLSQLLHLAEMLSLRLQPRSCSRSSSFRCTCLSQRTESSVHTAATLEAW